MCSIEGPSDCSTRRKNWVFMTDVFYGRTEWLLHQKEELCVHDRCVLWGDRVIAPPEGRTECSWQMCSMEGPSDCSTRRKNWVFMTDVFYGGTEWLLHQKEELSVHDRCVLWEDRVIAPPEGRTECSWQMCSMGGPSDCSTRRKNWVFMTDVFYGGTEWLFHQKEEPSVHDRCVLWGYRVIAPPEGRTECSWQMCSMGGPSDCSTRRKNWVFMTDVFYGRTEWLFHQKEELSVHDRCVLWGDRVIAPSEGRTVCSWQMCSMGGPSDCSTRRKNWVFMTDVFYGGTEWLFHQKEELSVHDRCVLWRDRVIAPPEGRTECSWQMCSMGGPSDCSTRRKNWVFMRDVFYGGTEWLLHQKEELSVHDRCVLWGDRVIAPPEGRTECSWQMCSMGGPSDFSTRRKNWVFMTDVFYGRTEWLFHQKEELSVHDRRVLWRDRVIAPPEGRTECSWQMCSMEGPSDCSNRRKNWVFMTDVFYGGTEWLLHQKDELSVHDRCVLWGDRVIAPPEGRTECSWQMCSMGGPSDCSTRRKNWVFMTDVFYEGTEWLLHQKEELSVHDRCVLWRDRVISPPEGRTECSWQICSMGGPSDCSTRRKNWVFMTDVFYGGTEWLLHQKEELSVHDRCVLWRDRVIVPPEGRTECSWQMCSMGGPSDCSTRRKNWVFMTDVFYGGTEWLLHQKEELSVHDRYVLWEDRVIVPPEGRTECSWQMCSMGGPSDCSTRRKNWVFMTDVFYGGTEWLLHQKEELIVHDRCVLWVKDRVIAPPEGRTECSWQMCSVGGPSDCSTRRKNWVFMTDVFYGGTEWLLHQKEELSVHDRCVLCEDRVIAPPEGRTECSWQMCSMGGPSDCSPRRKNWVFMTDVFYGRTEWLLPQKEEPSVHDRCVLRGDRVIAPPEGRTECSWQMCSMGGPSDCSTRRKNWVFMTDVF